MLFCRGEKSQSSLALTFRVFSWQFKNHSTAPPFEHTHTHANRHNKDGREKDNKGLDFSTPRSRGHNLPCSLSSASLHFNEENCRWISMADISSENASKCITVKPNTQGPHISTSKNQHITPDSTLNQALLPEVSLVVKCFIYYSETWVSVKWKLFRVI